MTECLLLPEKLPFVPLFIVFCAASPCHGPSSLPPNSTFADGKAPHTLSFGMKANVTCKKGFVKVGGGEEVECGPDGQFKWTFGMISCMPLSGNGSGQSKDD